ncbi:hypothetical protein ACFL6M_04350 [Candidatus Eisenbacteria bacterium]|uniref:Uncharacterized protein n=1 Tax=Eiseniibacteriota bacterium TaxID=2212470 RepID=A0ABV6YKE8_UNCEI
MKHSWIPIDTETRHEWEAICPPGEYRVIQAADVPPLIPSALVGKGHSFLIMASGTQDGTAYYMVNTNRLDHKDRAIDQEPFGLAFVGDDPVASGCFIHHGTWEGRTRKVPQSFLDAIAASGIETQYAVTSIPSTSAGKIEELEIASQQSAFQELVISLQRFTTHTNET